MTDPATADAASSRNPAVLFIVFNRLDTAREVMRAIALQRPKRLYIAGDGAREGRPDEEVTTRQVRAAITDMVDWPCELHTLFQENNLGCRRGVKTAIDWFFTSEPEGIILEDDVIPSPDFFRFCTEMLDRYRDEPRVMMVSGTNPLGAGVTSSRYFFSSLGSIWGWASWRDAWSRYDVDMTGWDNNHALRTELYRRLGSATARYLHHIFDFHRKHNVDTWDTQWTYALQAFDAVSVMPAANLIKNVGVVGTHSSVEMRNHNLAYGKIAWPCRPSSPVVEDDPQYRQQLTREILSPAILISTVSQLARKFRLHGLMKAAYGGLRKLRSGSSG